MRVLYSLLSSVVAIAIVLAIGFLIAREGLLFWGVSTVRSSITVMRQLAVNAGQYGTECRKLGVSDDEQAISAIQLRFTSDTEYVVEVVCGQFRLNPLVIETKQLPFMVKKLPGASGIVWGEARSGVRLGVWGRTRSIITENREVAFTSNPDEFLGAGPISSCQGYGYLCCAEESSIGDGDLFSGATDCPKTCFPGCLPRPVVLSLTTDPFYQPETRTLDVSAGEMVTFGYVVTMPPLRGKPEEAQSELAVSPTQSVVIEYGDGSSDLAVEEAGSFTHAYQCVGARCVYQLSLKVTDINGVSAAVTPVSQLKVVVTKR